MVSPGANPSPTTLTDSPGSTSPGDTTIDPSTIVTVSEALSAGASSSVASIVHSPVAASSGTTRLCSNVPSSPTGTSSKDSTGSPSLSVYTTVTRSEEHTSELQSRGHLVCR